MTDHKTEVFPPYRCVASFADGSRLTFDGLTREQARASMIAASEVHGDYHLWDWVTDANYIAGMYHLFEPPSPIVPFPVLDLTDCSSEEERQKALHDPFRPDDVP